MPRYAATRPPPKAHLTRAKAAAENIVVPVLPIARAPKMAVQKLRRLGPKAIAAILGEPEPAPRAPSPEPSARRAAATHRRKGVPRRSPSA